MAADPHADFVPDETNSIRLAQRDGVALGEDQLVPRAQEIMARLCQSPTLRADMGSDTAIVHYQGELYLVGELARRRAAG